MEEGKMEFCFVFAWNFDCLFQCRLELISCFRKFRGITNRLRGTGGGTGWPLLVQG